MGLIPAKLTLPTPGCAGGVHRVCRVCSQTHAHLAHPPLSLGCGGGGCARHHGKVGQGTRVCKMERAGMIKRSHFAPPREPAVIQTVCLETGFREKTPPCWFNIAGTS